MKKNLNKIKKIVKDAILFEKNEDWIKDYIYENIVLEIFDPEDLKDYFSNKNLENNFFIYEVFSYIKNINKNISKETLNKLLKFLEKIKNIEKNEIVVDLRLNNFDILDEEEIKQLEKESEEYDIYYGEILFVNRNKISYNSDDFNIKIEEYILKDILQDTLWEEAFKIYEEKKIKLEELK